MSRRRDWSCLVMLLIPLFPATVQAEVFERQVVVSQESHASDIGLAALREGGNAVDAAIATAFALAVTHPAAGNLGGGGFLVAFLADRREVVTFDFRETAPAASNERMYLGPDGKLAAPPPRWPPGRGCAGDRSRPRPGP